MPEQEQQVVGKIQELSVEDMLNFYYNQHLQKLVSAWINVTLYKSLPLTEVIGVRKFQAGPNQPPAVINITTKEGLREMLEQYNNNKNTIDAIDKVRQEWTKHNKLQKLI